MDIGMIRVAMLVLAVILVAGIALANNPVVTGLLTGQYDEPGPEPGDHTPITLKGSTVGYALRSKRRCKPLFISSGHLLDTEEAVKAVLMCLKGYRLPEPTRLADRLSKSSIQNPDSRSQENN